MTSTSPNSRYRKSAGCVSSLHYHIVWCPKYRRPVLGGAVTPTLEALLREKAAELGLEIRSLSVQPDHVHLFISAPPTEPIPRIVNQMKGYSARRLREQFPALKSRLPCMWSRSYYVGSVGHVSDETVRRYIEAQKGQ